MDQNIIIILFTILMFVLILMYSKRKENYNMGALIQLVAKDPQDSYLTGDAWKYYPPYGYPYGYGFVRPKKSELPLY